MRQKELFVGKVLVGKAVGEPVTGTAVRDDVGEEVGETVGALVGTPVLTWYPSTSVPVTPFRMPFDYHFRECSDIKIPPDKDVELSFAT